MIKTYKIIFDIDTKSRLDNCFEEGEFRNVFWSIDSSSSSFAPLFIARSRIRFGPSSVGEEVTVDSNASLSFFNFAAL